MELTRVRAHYPDGGPGQITYQLQTGDESVFRCRSNIGKIRFFESFFLMNLNIHRNLSSSHLVQMGFQCGRELWPSHFAPSIGCRIGTTAADLSDQDWHRGIGTGRPGAGPWAGPQLRNDSPCVTKDNRPKTKNDSFRLWTSMTGSPTLNRYDYCIYYIIIVLSI